MKSLVSISAIVLFVLLSAMTPSPVGDKNTETGINFQTGSWNEALELATKEDKLIFLDIYASWCGPCKLLKSKTFPDARVGQLFNSRFINYAVDGEKGIGVDLAKKYNITAYPTLLFIDGNGNLVAKTMGFHTPKQLIDVGNQVVNR